jgi:hypothetical protein
MHTVPDIVETQERGLLCVLLIWYGQMSARPNENGLLRVTRITPQLPMWQYVIKILLTAVVVVAVAEIAKRSTFWGAAIASLPLTSLLAFVWLYLDTGNSQRVADLSQTIFWLVLPSLTLFVVLPLFLRTELGFWFSLGAACAATAAAYFLMVWCMGRFGIHA